jgi:hydrophobic/amphiphilic exporter-1 (mainly G- bacteria), HAE1 family
VSLAELSIKRPIFISCIIFMMLVIGLTAIFKLPVDLFPDVNFPIITVTTTYPGAGPTEIETLITKPVEDEVSTISGLKRLTSTSQEGFSQVIAEFTLETDIKFAEQQVRDKVALVKTKIPQETEEPVIRRIDPSDTPVLRIAVESNLEDGKLYDLVDKKIKSQLQQVKDVGLVAITGGRKREIHVLLDRQKLKDRQVSAGQVAMQLNMTGENIPAGKVNESKKETVFKSVGEFVKIDEISNAIISLFFNDSSVRVKDVGAVKDSLQDEKRRAFVNGNKSLFVDIYKQSRTNTIEVVRGVKKKLPKIEENLKSLGVDVKLQYIQDGSREIDANILDVNETIFLGILLTILVVYFFLGSGRSTIITALALPNSIIGAFILMAFFDFSINIVTLTALVLAVGLLVDDAIVVRENIFRRLEGGEDAFTASVKGTQEVQLAVIATTLVVIAVFAPVAFTAGIVGQFLRQFGLTVCFAMVISLFDALTVAPMLSSYFAGAKHSHASSGIWNSLTQPLLSRFEKFQVYLENAYEKLLKKIVQRPITVLVLSFAVFVLCMSSVAFLPGNFLPPQDNGEFVVDMELPPGTNLEEMSRVAQEIDQVVRQNKEVELTGLTVGGNNEEPQVASLFVRMIDFKKRSITTSDMKERVRDQLKGYKDVTLQVKDYDPTGGAATRPFSLALLGNDQKALEETAQKLVAELKKEADLKEVDSSNRSGKPELQFRPRSEASEILGINSRSIGAELRAQVEGVKAAKFREAGEEYDIRVRLQENQRNLREGYTDTYVPNINQRLVKLRNVTTLNDVVGPANIDRQDRSRKILVSADIRAGGDLNAVMARTSARLTNGDLKLPPGMSFVYVGDSESFQELGQSLGVALIFAIIFIYMVLASLYESFVTPFTIMLALPLALGGAFVALLIAGESLNLFAFLGIFMLLGVAAKNSILLVDFAKQAMDEGQDRIPAIIAAGKTRLRPILMTSVALIAGTMPLAIGLNEASSQRTSMGVGLIGGTVTSTLLTLVVIPAAFLFIDRFREWLESRFPANRLAKGFLAQKKL